MKNSSVLYLSVIVVVCLFDCCSANQRILNRSKRDAYDLPDGWNLLMASLRQTFTCTEDGYFADVDNGCQVYHVCQSVPRYDGNINMMQYSFICGNGTVFNQLTLTCSHEDESIPCESSPDFFYINKRIGEPQSNILYDEDLERGVGLQRRDRSRNNFSPPALRDQPTIVDSGEDSDFEF